jgi:N-acetylglucosaminyldiphosphoundecaprenol N-acetyl-beta-D-mannosaminyltransferase
LLRLFISGKLKRINVRSHDETARPIPRVNVLGVGLSAINLDSALAAIDTAVKQRSQGYICVTGVHGVSEAQEDPQLRAILNGAFLNTPDGMPMVWMGRLQGFKEMDRVYGPDLMLLVASVSAERGYRHFFYGGGPGVAEALKENLTRRFPGMQVVGTYTPPFRPLNAEEERQLSEQVRQSRPDFFWVGLSTPKQERFMAQYWQKLDATLFLGVGAAFDFHAGRVRQAPRWMQRSGLEWFFRLCSEPRRLWKRYLKNNPLFLGRAFLQLTRLRRYTLD